MKKNTARITAAAVVENLPDRLLTEAQAAEYLQVSRGHLRQLRNRGPLPGRRNGPPWVELGQRQPRYRLSDLERYIESRLKGRIG